MRLKKFVLATSTIFISVIGCLFVAELVLWFFPVRSGLQVQPMNAENPVARFEPGRQFIFSDEWNFAIVNRGRTNNAGFINDQDYLKIGPGPLVAVIGDSYVEAQMVAYKDTMHGQLQAKLGDGARVYSFGASGAALSQYLAFAEFARREYHPQLMLFIVVGNDFDESLNKYKPARGSYSYIFDRHGMILKRLGEYEPSLIRQLARRSALARYLYMNLEIQNSYSNLRRLWGKGEPRYFGNTLEDTSRERLTDSIAGVKAFFRDLPKYSGLPTECIVFVVDGIRDMIYDPRGNHEVKKSFAHVMRDRFMTIARGAGYEVVDLGPRFAEHFKKHGQRFEFATDGHWNRLGHAVAAEAVQASTAVQRFEAQVSGGVAGRRVDLAASISQSAEDSFQTGDAVASFQQSDGVFARCCLSESAPRIRSCVRGGGSKS